MAKAYSISLYRSISNPDALAAYAKLAGARHEWPAAAASWPVAARPRPMRPASPSAPC